MTKATVLIPAYHHRLNLTRCLEAWRRQTVPVDQTIVIDRGGSPIAPLLQGNEELVKAVSPQWEPINQGIIAAWQHVKNDYIVICSHDLLFESTALERMLDLQDGNRRSNPIVYSLDRHSSLLLDRLDWEGTECKIFEDLPGFWEMPNNFGGLNSRAPGWGAHMLYSGNTRAGWQEFAPQAFPPTTEIGSDECWLRQAEVDAQRWIQLMPFAVYHQWHPRITGTWKYDVAGELPPTPKGD